MSRGCAVLTPTYDRDTASYLFSHDEVARLARESLPAERRAELHARLAAALDETEGASQSLVATHFEAAGQSAHAHRTPCSRRTRRYDCTIRGGVNLLAVAARHAPSPAALASVRVRLAELAETAGHYEDAEALCDLALNWYEGSEDPVQAIRLKRMRSLVRMQRGQGARETLDALFALVDEATLVGANAERASILLVASQMLARLGEQREAQRVAEECLAIAEGVGDPVLLSDSCNRLGLCVFLADGSRARELFTRALDLTVTLSDVVRRVRVLNNIGILELSANRWIEARRSLESAVDLARTAGLIELWARASLNLGVLALRIGNHEQARPTLDEALRLSAEAQHTELQLISTYNLGHLAREMGDFERGGETYELAMELAERIGQSEIQAGALAGMALCSLARGRWEDAYRHHDRLAPMLHSQSEWFQSREIVESLAIHRALRESAEQAAPLFRAALALAESRDVYGATWLIAEFGVALREIAPALIDEAVRRYAGRPEVLDNPRIRQQFGVLILDSPNNC